MQTSTSASRSQNFIITFSRSVLVHLPVRDDDARVGELLLQPPGLPVDRLDAVVDPEDLAVAEQLAPDRAQRQSLVVRTDVGEHRLPVLGRRVDVDMSRIPVSAISSVRGIGVAVMVSTSTCVRIFFSRSLCATPNRCSSSTTRSPRSLNVTSELRSRCVPITTSTAPFAASSMTLLLLGRRHEPREHRDLHRERRVALAERDEVLLGQQRRRDQHRDLLAVHHGLERRADGDLGLAVPDVAADQAVHRLGLLHVALDLVDRGQLVAGLVERERVLQLALPRRVGPERVALDGHAHAVEPDELAGHVAHRALDRGLVAFTQSRAAQAVQARRLAADVLRDDADLVRGHVQPVALARTPGAGSRARRRRSRGA